MLLEGKGIQTVSSPQRFLRRQASPCPAQPWERSARRAPAMPPGRPCHPPGLPVPHQIPVVEEAEDEQQRVGGEQLQAQARGELHVRGRRHLARRPRDAPPITPLSAPPEQRSRRRRLRGVLGAGDSALGAPKSALTCAK